MPFFLRPVIFAVDNSPMNRDSQSLVEKGLEMAVGTAFDGGGDCADGDLVGSE